MIDEARQYETEAEATRERIAATIDDLQERLSPRAIVTNAVDSIGATGTDVLASLRSMVFAHPLALAAAGLAIGVTLLARSRVRSATIEYGDSYAAYADYDDGFAADLVDDTADVGPARARIEAIAHQAHVTVDDNPLAVVLVGAATGALLGSIVRVSATEHALFGSARARLAAAGHAAVDAARDELDIANFSFAGGTAGIAERASQAFANVVHAAGTGLARTPPGDFTARSAD